MQVISAKNMDYPFTRLAPTDDPVWSPCASFRVFPSSHAVRLLCLPHLALVQDVVVVWFDAVAQSVVAVYARNS